MYLKFETTTNADFSVPEIRFDGIMKKQSSSTEDNIEALGYCRDSQGGGFVSYFWDNSEGTFLCKSI
jgi:hypothetical protein